VAFATSSRIARETARRTSAIFANQMSSTHASRCIRCSHNWSWCF